MVGWKVGIGLLAIAGTVVAIGSAEIRTVARGKPNPGPELASSPALFDAGQLLGADELAQSEYKVCSASIGILERGADGSKTPGSYGGGLSAKHESGNRELEVIVVASPNEETSTLVDERTYAVAPAERLDHMPDGLPAGTSARQFRTATSRELSTRSRYERVEVKLRSLRTAAVGDPPEFTLHETDRDRRLLALLARQVLARVVCYDATDRGKVSIGDEPVQSFTTIRSGTRYLDLADWARARGWTVGKPDSVPSITLTKDGREILRPLAAMQAKIDGEWQELGDVVAEKDGRWLVPASLDGLAQ